MMRATRSVEFAVIAASAVATVTSFVHSGQILETSADSLTTYLPAAVSSGQDVWPLALQRGVDLDGTERLGAPLAWAFGGNPWGEEWSASGWLDDIALSTGAFSPAYADLDLAAPGFSWVVGRSYNSRQQSANKHSNGYQGRNWFQSSQPEIAFYNNADDAKDRVYILYGADRYLEFQRSGVGSSEFKGKNGCGGIVIHTSGSPDVYTYYDQQGNQVAFFGDDTQSGQANWQFWKQTDAAGNIAYVGDKTSASTAVTSGYYATRRIKVAYDTAERRYTYSYTSVNGTQRLTEVKAETKTGATWGSPGTVTEVGRVEYAYYSADADAHGKAGDLKVVTVRTPLSDSGATLDSGVYSTQKQYFRYYDAAWSNSDGRRGESHQIKMILDPEGTRRFDWDQDGSITDDDFLTASDDDLKPYAAAYFEYVSTSDRRIAKVWFEGECGCGGGASGDYAFTYEDNAFFVDDTGAYDYDADSWIQRVVIDPPDRKELDVTGEDAWITQYFDEVAQPLGRVESKLAPATVTGQVYWATRIDRNSGGQIEKRYWPKNITYTHSSAGFSPATSDGLIRTYARVPSGDMKGFVESVKYQKGTSAPANQQYFETKLTYTSTTWTPGSTLVITRPFISAEKSYSGYSSDGLSGFDTTDYVYGFYSGAAALIPETVETQHPAVSTSKNGSGVRAVEEEYLRKDGTLAFTKSARNIIGYTEYTGGQLTKAIEDADTTKTGAGEDFNGVVIPTGFSSSGAPYHVRTTYSYDSHGRVSGSTLPDGRQELDYYSRLNDGRIASIGVPRVAGGTYYGPASYTVTNFAEQVEGEGVIGIALAGTTAAVSGWINEASGDPIAAQGLAGLTRWSTSLYNGSGARVTERRDYHTIPATSPGTDKTNYDRTAITYDDAGRVNTVNDPSRTIRQTEYDWRGRPIHRYIGAEDGGDSPIGELIWSGGTDGGDGNGGTGDTGGGGGSGSGATTAADCVQILEAFTNLPGTRGFRDIRDGLEVLLNPEPPHALFARDNLSRVIAVAFYSDETGLDLGDNPLTQTANRHGLMESFYDERGRVWKRVWHHIDTTNGSSTDTLEELYWYDDEGRIIKVDGPELYKIQFDRLGRITHHYSLAKDNDTQYSHVYDTTNKLTKVDGDTVLQETQTVYDNLTGTELMKAQISRFHDDETTGTTGTLDTNADANPLKFTAGNIKGRIQITASWYDELWRRRTMSEYGTNSASGNAGTFDYSAVSEPSASSTSRIVTKYRYDTSGKVDQVTLPNGSKTVYAFDHAGRVTRLVENWVNYTGTASQIGPGDEDRVTEFTYGYPGGGIQNGLVRTVNARRNPSSLDQTTTYTFGNLTGSDIDAGFLLSKVQYPDSSGGTDVVTYGYNKALRVKSQTDQAGNILEFEYDELRREVKRSGTAATGFDATVKSIVTTYSPLGRVSKVEQLDASPSVLDEVQIKYDGWLNVLEFEQDPDSAIAVSGTRASYKVSYTYAKAGGTAGRNTTRRTGATLPGSLPLTYDYTSTSTQLWDAASRARFVKLSATSIAGYEYNGRDQVVGTALPAAGAFSNLYTASTTYSGLDRFDRVTKTSWTKDLSTDRNFYEVDYSYDSHSNPTLADDQVHDTKFDAKYTVDDLDRLIQTQEGDWDAAGSSFTSTSRNELWTLSAVDNWNQHQLDLNGNGSFTDSGDLNENNPDSDTDTYTPANELLERDLNNDTVIDRTLTYDAVGNMTDDGGTATNYKYEYDVWGRLIRVKKSTTNALVIEYRYNGLGYLTGYHYDADGDGTVEATLTQDPWYYLAYDEQWRIVATYRYDGTVASRTEAPKEQYVYHAPGLDGAGGAGLLDSPLVRRRDANTAWTAASDGTLEELIYYCQNPHGDVVAILSATGQQVEQVRYSSYGVPFGLPAGDVDSNGAVDLFDLQQINNWVTNSQYNVLGDLDLDGDVDATDAGTAVNLAGTTLGRGVLSRSTVANRFGYAGYHWDRVVSRYHVRNRVYAPEMGRWLNRDPFRYSDGMNLYGYVASRPIAAIDPMGLFGCLFGVGPGCKEEDDWEDMMERGRDMQRAKCRDLVNECEISYPDGYNACLAQLGFWDQAIEANRAARQERWAETLETIIDILDVINPIPGPAEVKLLDKLWDRLKALKPVKSVLPCVIGGASGAPVAGKGCGKAGTPKIPWGKGPRTFPSSPNVLPPGWTPGWKTGPASRPSSTRPNWWDPAGGEWRPHLPDNRHPDWHWDYRPGPGKEWINVDPSTWLPFPGENLRDIPKRVPLPRR